MGGATPKALNLADFFLLWDTCVVRWLSTEPSFFFFPKGTSQTTGRKVSIGWHEHGSDILFGQDDGMSLRGVIDFWLKLILNQVSHQKFHEVWSLAIYRSTATYLPFKMWLSIGMLQDCPEICQGFSAFPQTSPDTCEQNPHVLLTLKHSGFMNVHPFFLGWRGC